MSKPLVPEADLARTVRQMHKSLQQRLAKNVRALRKAAGLTQKEAAERCEIHWRHWQKVEAGGVNVTMATIVQIARVLRVDLPELFGEAAQGACESGPRPAEKRRKQVSH